MREAVCRSVTEFSELIRSPAVGFAAVRQRAGVICAGGNDYETERLGGRDRKDINADGGGAGDQDQTAEAPQGSLASFCQAANSKFDG
jgi:hypothetical protein